MRLKSLLSILTTILAISPVLAGKINSNDAAFIAKSFLGKEVKEIKPVATRSANPISSELTDIYIFNATDKRGFVIIAADDSVNPILGYSDKGEFNFENSAEPALWLLSMYQKNLANIGENAGNKVQTQTLQTRDTVEPLLKTQWNQDYPFNNDCPVISGVKTLTGCVATAMAQVINYENKTKEIKAIPGYTTRSGLEVEALPSKQFNYGNLNDADIASLMRYCGQSVQMDYGINESSSYASDIPKALSTYFGWNPEVKMLYRENYNDEHWNRIILEEIQAGHPLLYSANSLSNKGHTFVVDGISDEYYHVNWGWGGMSDGYYSFSVFSSNQTAEYYLAQKIITTRDDEPSGDVITYGTTINGINYQLQDDFTAVVLPLKNGEKYQGDIVIPSTVEFEGKIYSVNYLGLKAFNNCSSLTSISIPAAIQQVQPVSEEIDGLFYGCENLNKVYIEDLSAYNNIIFYNEFDAPTCNGADLYLNEEIIKDLIIPEGIEEIGDYKFFNCTSLETFYVASNLKSIGKYAFGHSNLKKIDISNSTIYKIGKGSFMMNKLLEELRLPETLRYIGEGFCFSNAYNLKKVVCMAQTLAFVEPDAGRYLFSEQDFGNARLYVPDEVLDLYKRAEGWNNFIEIYPLSEEKPIPETINITINQIPVEINLSENFAKILDNGYRFGQIPDYIEYNGIEYPVEEIADSYFANYSQEEIILPTNLKKFGVRCFRYTTINRELIIPDNVKAIPLYSFWGFKTPKLIFGENVERINEYAFFTGYEDEEEYERNLVAWIPEIECRNPAPPIMKDNTFDKNHYENAILYIPYGSRKAYQTAPGWSSFKNIKTIGDKKEESLSYDISLTAEISGKTSLQEGMPMKISGRISNPGSQDVNGIKFIWEVDGTSNGEMVIDEKIIAGNFYDFNIKIPIKNVSAGEHELLLTVYPGNNEEDEDKSDNSLKLCFETFKDQYYKVTLIDFFTTENCGWSPSAIEVLNEGIEHCDKKDFVAQVYNHCGFQTDFMTLNEDYEWFYNEDGLTYTPGLMLNRTDINNSQYTPLLPTFDLISLQDYFDNEPELCDVMVSIFLERGKEKGNIKTILTKNDNFDLSAGYDYITVYIIEDSIPQRNQLNADADFKHRNVLRKILTNPWGERIKWDGNKCYYYFEFEYDPEWNKENLSAVAFIHRHDQNSPIGCQAYTAGSSKLPQYLELSEEKANWIPWEPVKEFSFGVTSTELRAGNSFDLNVTLKPDNEVGRRIIWTSEHPVYVSEDGLVTSVLDVWNYRHKTVNITGYIGDFSANCEVILNKRGDVNNDGVMDYADIDKLVNRILRKDLDVIYSYGDINQDDRITISDATALAKIISNGKEIDSGTLPELGSDILYCGDSIVRIGDKEYVPFVLNNTHAYSGFSIEMVHDETMELLHDDGILEILPSERTESFTFSGNIEQSEDGGARFYIVGLSYDHESIKGDSGPIFYLGFKKADDVDHIFARSSEIIFATENDEDVNFPFFHFYYSYKDYVDIMDFYLDKRSYSGECGTTLQLKLNIAPNNVTDKSVIWTSSDPRIASVDESGLVSLLNPGVATITVASTHNSFKYDSCEITVTGEASVENLFDEADNKISIYTPEGILVKKNCNIEEIKSLSKGIYIIVSGKQRYKISI